MNLIIAQVAADKLMKAGRYAHAMEAYLNIKEEAMRLGKKELAEAMAARFELAKAAREKDGGRKL